MFKIKVIFLHNIPTSYTLLKFVDSKVSVLQWNNYAKYQKN
jgi:hypothetical protein